LTCRVAVLGGGAAGVVAADALATRGAEVDLFERNPILGGLHRSVECDGDVFDIGAFFFTADHALIETFPVARALLVPVNHQAVSVTPRGSLDGYPCTPRGYLHDHGVLHSTLALGDLLLSRLRYRHPGSVPEFSMRSLGGRVYRNAGLKAYLERFCGAPDSEIDLDVVRPRLNVLVYYARLGRVARLALLGSRRKLQPHFARPRAGFPALYDAMAETLTARGVTVRRATSLTAMQRTPGGFELSWNGNHQVYRQVISTIPPPFALQLLGEPAGADIQHLSLVSLFYRGKLRIPGNVVYNFTREGLWKRFTVLSRLYGPSRGEDYFTVEVTNVGAMTPRVDELAGDFEKHAARLRMFETPPRRVGHTVTERAYPAALRGQRATIDSQRARLAELGLRLVGRQGNNAYLSSHDVALAARELAVSIPLDTGG
jgi:protoporphyrinogen oxidase